MSFVGVLNQRGASVDHDQLRRLAPSVPSLEELTGVFIDGAFGMARWPDDANRGGPREDGPVSVDGRAWVVGNIRIDAKDDLLRRLDMSPQAEPLPRDSSLLLRAYQKWGVEFLNHVIGDFSFVLWDGAARRLVAGRDHLGIRPLYYAELPNGLIISDRIGCIRRHPECSNKLDDLAVCDYLMFGVNATGGATVFADVRKVPPATVATIGPSRLSLKSYWTLPIDDPLQYKSPADYVDQCRLLLKAAVADRLPKTGAGILMSGGLDSSSIAATASSIVGDPSSKLCAYTTVFDSLVRDDERYFSGRVATFLGLPIEYHVRDEGVVEPDWASSPLEAPEPPASPFSLRVDRARHQAMARTHQVVLFGEGPDNALHYEWRPFLHWLIRGNTSRHLWPAAVGYLKEHRKFPLSGAFTHAFRSLIAPSPGAGQMPPWIRADVMERYQLRDRWTSYFAGTLYAPVVPHHVRPRGYRSFYSPQWQSLFEGFSSEATGSGLEVRHPYLDLRLLRFMLAVPAVPWCRNKLILRKAMKGMLPDECLRRRKSPMRESPEHKVLGQMSGRMPPLDSLTDDWVDRGLAPASRPSNVGDFWSLVRAHTLGLWLNRMTGKFHVRGEEMLAGGARAC